MNEIQQKQFECLCFFHNFCEKHHLYYVLEGGTCLGAIRHNGFIPWDDDIDVAMPRKDYDKLIELSDVYFQESNQLYTVQSYHKDPHFTYNFSKVRDNSSTMVETFFKYTPMNHGLWIDIFPYDGLGNDEKKAQRRLKKFKHTWLGYYLTYPVNFIRYPRKYHVIRDLLLDFVLLLASWFNINNCINKRIDKTLKKVPCETSKYVSSAQSFLKPKLLLREWFSERELHTFETSNFYIPKDYHQILEVMYGDYMTPPEEADQGGHHLEHVDLNTPWREFKKNYRKW